MNRHVNSWVAGMLTLAGILASGAKASAQFNPYVMPRFNLNNPAAPLNNLVSPVLPTFNPVDPVTYPSPYVPYGGFYPGPSGGTLMGWADLYRAYGTAIMNTEQARSLREQAVQAKFDTAKKRFELAMYLRANTPTLAEELARASRNLVIRVRNNATPGEISNGSALNVMLDDARKIPNRRLGMDLPVMGEEMLGQLNVTSSFASLGILRNEGKIPWTLPMQELLTADQRKSFDMQAQTLVQGAMKGNMDAAVFREFSTELDRAYDNLLKRVNEIGGQQYLEARRFMTDLREARTALEKGEAQNQAQYQKFIVGGRTVQEVVDFMVKRGLRFAPATVHDEAAYRAFHSALASFGVALNSGASESRDSK